ncbi:MAG: metal-dependent transcriptional regulator [Eggerthellaceae bacterium]|nr:metal-dependent transcriptional regulator [Eggerthellaceae bacterium]
MADQEKLSHALEDYLEAIVMMAPSIDTPVKSVAIASKLGVSKPSVNNALSALKAKGFITQEPYGDIYLTAEGLAYGQDTLNRHNTLMSFFIDVLGVEPGRAEEEACCIEHVISDDTFERWTEHVDKVLGK